MPGGIRAFDGGILPSQRGDLDGDPTSAVSTV